MMGMEHSLSQILWRLAGVLFLVFANGFFVAAEFAIVAVRKTRIDQMIAEGHTGARAVRRAISDPDSYIAATQLGITLASLGLGWVGEPFLAHRLAPLDLGLERREGGARLLDGDDARRPGRLADDGQQLLRVGLQHDDVRGDGGFEFVEHG